MVAADVAILVTDCLVDELATMISEPLTLRKGCVVCNGLDIKECSLTFRILVSSKKFAVDVDLCDLFRVAGICLSLVNSVKLQLCFLLSYSKAPVSKMKRSALHLLYIY